MDNFTLTKNKSGHLHFNREPTGVWIEKTDSGYWCLRPIGPAVSQVALFSRRRSALKAAIVFIEGVSQKDDETQRDAAIRALRSCAETGSTMVVKYA